MSPPPGTASRPLGTLENFFKLLADSGKPLNREHWTISLALRLRFPTSVADPAAHLRRAWTDLRREHPNLGATLGPPDPADPQGRTQLVVGPLDADAWVRDSFTEHGKGDADALFERQRPAPTATCHWLPGSGEVVLRSSHWRIDGLGLVMLGHEFLAALAGALRRRGSLAVAVDADSHPETQTPSPAAVAPRLAPSLEEFAHDGASGGTRRAEEEEEQQQLAPRPATPPALAAGADALVAEFLRGVPSIGFPTAADGAATAAPGPSAHTTARLGAAASAQVAAACRARGLGPTAAVHAAVVRAAATRHAQHPLARSYAAFSPVSLRGAVRAAGAGAGAGAAPVVGLYISGLPVCVDGVVPGAGAAGRAKGFGEVARELGAVYARDLERFCDDGGGRGGMVGMLRLADPYVRRTTALFGAPPPEGLPPVQTPDLSSVGKLETYLRGGYVFGDGAGDKVELVDAWIGTEMLTRSLQFHLWSWRGELVIGVSFNQSFYDKTFVDEVLGQVKEELLAGLDIQEENEE